MKHVQVLMSTYNGEKYLANQLDSILNQSGIEVSILIRDDGSKDSTKDILKKYALDNPNIGWYEGENLGPQRSFFHLLRKADNSADYYAFSDQDDYWMKEKLEKAVEYLDKKNKSIPLLYAGEVIYASEDLKEQQKFAYKNEREPAFGNALVENICIGCTQVFNVQLLKLVQKEQPQNNVWHDWWMYLTASCFGEVIYDTRAFILYRQHEKNQLGMKNSWNARWKNRIKHFYQLKGTISSQAQEFIRIYGMQYPDYARVNEVAEYKEGFIKRIRLVRNKNVYRQQRWDNRIYKILFFAGIL